MRNEQVNYCGETGKYCYSSEAKATMAVTRYDDIQRTYLCDHCDQWHTTSIGVGLAVEKGIIEAPVSRIIPMDDIKKRLNKLLKRENGI